MSTKPSNRFWVQSLRKKLKFAGFCWQKGAYGRYGNYRHLNGAFAYNKTKLPR